MSATLGGMGLRGLQRTLDALRRVDEEIEREVDQALDGVAHRLLASAKSRVPTWRRVLQQSLETRKPESCRRDVGYFSADVAQIGAFQEYGTARHGARTKVSKPPPEYKHGASHKRPPADALEDWAQDHGFESGHQVAAIIYRNQGVPAQPHLFPAMEEQRPGFRDDVRDAAREAIRRADRW